MNLAKMAFNKLKAVEEDKKCLHCGKSAKEGCDCPDMAPDDVEDDGEEGSEHEAGESKDYEGGEMEAEGEDRIGRGEKGMVVNIKIGKG